MPYNIPTLILPLIGGYIIINKVIFFRTKYRRVSSQRLVFDSFIAGVILFSTTYFIREIIFITFPVASGLCNKIISYFPYHEKLLGTSVISFLFAIIFTYLTNYIINRWFVGYKYRFFTQLIFEIGDELEQLFLESLLEPHLVQISLKNNKAYIGFIAEVNEPQKTNYIALLPVASGYRKSKSKQLVITTPYNKVVETLYDEDATNHNIAPKIDYMRIVINQNEILTANRFDPNIYNLFQESEKNES